MGGNRKPRLKWTPQLHQLFVDAVSQLGGADKVTPKSVMRVMRIPGLTSYHLKSHLQKYRLAKNRDPSTTDCGLADIRRTYNTAAYSSVDRTRTMLDVQSKLEEQMEVQRHLQLRIEAQGKYLQSVLSKALEALADYSASSMGVKVVESELSDCSSSSQSQSRFVRKRAKPDDCSTEICFISDADHRNQIKVDASILYESSDECGEINQCHSATVGM